MLLLSLGSINLSALDFFTELPRPVIQGDSRFPSLFSAGGRLYLLYQHVNAQEGGGTIQLELRSSRDGGDWSTGRPINGAVPYTGTAVPQVYGVFQEGDGNLLVALSKNATDVTIFRVATGRGIESPDTIELATIPSPQTIVFPKIYGRPDGSAIMFASQQVGAGLNLVYAVSKNGQAWSGWKVFETTLTKNINLNSSWAFSGGRDLVVFQSRDASATRNSQLYLRSSADAGQTWTQPSLITDFSEAGEAAKTEDIDNQRPQLNAVGGSFVLLWERAPSQGGTPKAVLQKLDTTLTGAPPGTLTIKRLGPMETVGINSLGAYAPQYLRYQNTDAVIWFSNALGNSRVYLSFRSGNGWESRQYSSQGGAAAYPSAVVHGGRLHVTYHFRDSSQDQAARVLYVEPDQRVAVARLIGTGVGDGARTRFSAQKFVIQPPDDVSGINGFAYQFSQNGAGDVPKVVNLASGQPVPELFATREGTWWLAVRARDGAGNWSEISRYRFTLVTTPPPPPSLDLPAADASGFVTSNTFAVDWSEPASSATVAYQYSLAYLADDPKASATTPTESALAASALAPSPAHGMDRVNVEDGLYHLAVWAIDDVGNRSQPTMAFLRFNKFVPSTQVWRLDMVEDELANRSLTIIGRGYTAEGDIDQIVLSKQPGEAPVYTYNRQDFRIISDRRIEGLKFSEITTGTYWLGLRHTKRGLYFATEALTFPGQGLVKFGDFNLKPGGSYIFEVPKPGLFQVGDLALWLMIGLLALVIPAAGWRLRVIGDDARALEAATKALLTGRSMSIDSRNREVAQMKRLRLNLRVKFILFFVTLVIAVVLLVAIPLSNYTIESQRRTLAHGLSDRLDVIMDSLVAGAANLLPAPEGNAIELSALTNQGQALPEAMYVTITSPSKEDPKTLDAVWGTNDAELLREVGEATTIDANLAKNYNVLVRSLPAQPLLIGRSAVNDQVTGLLDEYRTRIDTELQTKLGDLPAQLEKFSAELSTIVLSRTEESQRRSREIGREQRAITAKLNAAFRESVPHPLSVPAFDPDNYNINIPYYIFYKPVLYRTSGEDKATAHYVHGFIRMGITTVRITQAIADTRNSILLNIAIFAAIAVAAGFVGAFILSSIIIIPIRRLVTAVGVIRDTEDKEELESYAVGIKSHDELRTLGDSIDQMAHGLAKAAAATKELLVGKDIQKMFIPLEVISTDKRKGTTGKLETKRTEIFGYYEGAKGVSGDYFNYIQLDDKQFAIIKCDVAGKGVPASLIMVEVATLFLNYFDNWNEKVKERRQINKALKVTTASDAPALNELVLHINDLVAEREFEGRFAALNIVLYNEETGSLAFCNAGDNKVSIYRDSLKDLEILTLFNSPAAGNMSSKIFPIQFKQEYNRIESGDILLLYTDGIEEAQHKYRAANWQPEPVNQADLDANLVPADTQVGVEFEEMGAERVREIIGAVHHKSSFTLTKHKYPRQSEPLLFDFSTIGETAEDTVMALMAVEKVFRIVPNPSAGDDQIVQVDKRVDAFLEKHFIQYRQYFAHPVAVAEGSQYHRYARLQEDPQYDDLTIVAVRKK